MLWTVLSAVFGWMSAGSAEQLATERAKTAVLNILTSICVERFQQDAGSDAKLKVLQEKPAWNQAAYVVKQGWATMPENDISENSAAQARASQILTISSS